MFARWLTGGPPAGGSSTPAGKVTGQKAKSKGQQTQKKFTN